MYIKVEAVTGAKKEFTRKIANDIFIVSVKELPERNTANRRILKLIRNEFDNKQVIIKIISGHHSTHKILSVEGV